MDEVDGRGGVERGGTGLQEEVSGQELILNGDIGY